MKTEQFSLRQLLKAMLIVAVVSAIAAPFLRKFSAEQLVWLGAAIGTGAVGFGLAILLLALNRRRCEAAAGRVLLRFDRPRKPSRWSRRVIACLAAFQLLVIASMPLIGTGNHALMITNLLNAFFMSAVIAMQWWDSKEGKHEMCENGVIVGARWHFLWKHVKYYAWVKTTELKIVYKNQWIYLAVPQNQRNEVESLIEDKISTARHADAAGTAKK